MPTKEVLISKFDLDLINTAREKHYNYLKSGLPCCYNCGFSINTSIPEHASHYVSCIWLQSQVRADSEKAAVGQLVPNIDGQQCPTYKPKKA